MRIRRLDITGFKSFPDRTVLTFEDGVTGVVGPNGCGKSNVADAIRWVLGEQSARQLRGRSMEDVIFDGSESRAPLSLAEVTLTFEVDRSSDLPARFQGLSEISVGRRLYRTGESEYLVNRAPGRLLDVQDIFAGSGVGRTAYSMVEQGRIGQIVSARPVDRRAVIEEAAGITRYKRRREAAGRKLEATRQNLLRVADIVAELSSRLASLNRQARRAERFKALRARIRELELALGVSRWLETSATRRAAEERRREVEAAQAEAGARLAAVEGAVETDRAALAVGERRVAELAAREQEVAGAARVAEVSAEAASREREQIGERERSQVAELEALAAQAGELAREREELERRHRELQALGDAGAARRAEAEERLLALRGEHLQALGELAAARARAAEAAGRAGSSGSELARLERQRADLEARLRRCRAEGSEVATSTREVDASRSRHAEQLGRTRQLRLRLEEQRGAHQDLLERTRTGLIENEARLITLREELQDRRARLQSLLEVLRAYEGHGKGVRSLMTRPAEGGAAAPGALGLVADLVSAPAEYETAIEAALGQRLQWVVVESQARGVEAVEWLRETAGGRASLVPLGELRPPDTAAGGEEGASAPGVVARALEVVRFDARWEGLVRWLLGDVLLVCDLPAALELWRAGERRTLATLDGEVVEASGVVAGGPLEGEGHGALQRRREVQELEDSVRDLEAQFSLARERQRGLQARVHQLEAGLKGFDQDGREKELAALEQEKDLLRLAEQLDRLAARAAELQADGAALEDELSALAREEEELRLAAASAAAEQGRSEEQAREASGRAGDIEARAEAAAAALVGLQVQAAADGERREALATALRRLEGSARDLEERRERLRAALDEGWGRAEVLGSQLEDAEQELARLGAELERVREALARERRAKEAAGEAARGREGEARELRRRAEALSQEQGESALTAREKALELVHLEEQIRERCQAELRQEISRFHLAPAPGEAERTLLEDLKGQAERMGPINLTAIEEYDELFRRHEFLSSQKADLEASAADLQAAIVRIDRASRERFRETFDRVNEKFQQVFPRLFNGGRAGLVLTEDADGGEVEGGVEIFAQPPGKKLQSVSLLSGGEKALTAVALVFAIFLIKPTPFCLLDEVDAPLDDVNVGRYNDLVREMAHSSQFILITHNKRTMETVDALYGVTMEEPGVSKLISVRLAGAARPAAA